MLELFQKLHQKEKKFSGHIIYFLGRRKKYIDMIISLCNKIDYYLSKIYDIDMKNNFTWCLGVELMDLFFSKNRKIYLDHKIFLYACISLAYKYAETYSLNLRQLSIVCECDFEKLKWAEIKILQKINFNVKHTTVYEYIHMILHISGLEIFHFDNEYHELIKKSYDNCYLEFRSSTKAFSIVYYVLSVKHNFDVSRQIKRHFGISFENFKDCVSIFIKQNNTSSSNIKIDFLLPEIRNDNQYLYLY